MTKGHCDRCGAELRCASDWNKVLLSGWDAHHDLCGVCFKAMQEWLRRVTAEIASHRVTVWIAYYADGSAYRVFGSEVEALRYANERGMRVKEQEIDVAMGATT